MGPADTPLQEKRGGLKRSAVNVMVPLCVFFVPLILYLLYINSQERYFKSYYQRELGTIARQMDGRLTYLQRPMSQWLSGVDEARFRATAPRWLGRFMRADCDAFRFSVDATHAGIRNIVATILPHRRDTVDLARVLTRLHLPPDATRELQSLLRTLKRLNNQRIGTGASILESAQRIGHQIDTTVLDRIQGRSESFAKGRWDLIDRPATATLNPSEPQLFQISATPKPPREILESKIQEVVGLLATELATRMLNQAANSEMLGDSVEFDTLTERHADLVRIDEQLQHSKDTLAQRSAGQLPSKTQKFFEQARGATWKSRIVVALLSANTYSDIQETIQRVSQRLRSRISSNAKKQRYVTFASDNARRAEKRACSAHIPIADIIPYDSGQSIFQSLLISDREGRVVYQDKNGFPQLLQLKPQSGGFPFSSSRSNPAQHQASQNGDASLIPSEFVIHAGGANQQVFCQPLSPGFSLTDGPHPQPLLLCGLTQADTFFSKVKAVSPNKIVIAVGALALAILLTPLLKLQLIAPDEPYRPLDQLALWLSLYLLVAIGTIAWLDASRYLSLNTRLDTAMKTISGSLARNFDRELDETATILGQFERHFAFSAPTHDRWAGAFTDSCVKECGNFPEYPPFESLGVVGYDGLTLPPFDVTARDRPISGGRVSQRTYFKPAKYGALWNNGGCERLPHGCYVERIFSMNEGIRLSAVTTQSDHGWPVRSGPSPELSFKPRINALFKRFTSFMSAPLPPGFQFAVVRISDGTVLFHSDDRLGLVENFYDEVGHDSTLLAAIRNMPSNRSTEVLSGDYHGVEHAFAVTALANGEWSLVVLRDRRLAQTVNGEAVIASLLGLFLFLNALILMAWLTRPLYEHPMAGWIWPNRMTPEGYVPVFYLAALVVVTEAWIIIRTPINPIEIFALLVLLSTLTVSAVLGLLTPDRKFARERVKKRLPLVLTAFIMATMSLAAWYGTISVGTAILLFSLYSVFAALYTAIAFAKGNESPLTIPSTWVARIHPWFVFGLFILLAAIPAWAAFETAWRINSEAFVRANVTGVSHALNRWQTALNEDARRIRRERTINRLPIDRIPCSGIVLFVATGSETKDAPCNDETKTTKQTAVTGPVDSHENPSRSTGILGNAPPLQTELADFVTFLLPKMSSESAWLRSFYAGSSTQTVGRPARGWLWSTDRSFTLTGDARRPDTAFKNVRLIGLAGRLPISFAGWWRLEGWGVYIVWLPVLLMALWLFRWLIDNVCNRIFAFDALIPPRQSLIPTFEGRNQRRKEREWWINSGRHHILIRPGFDVAHTLRRIAPEKTVAVIDCSSELHVAMALLQTHRNHAFVLDHFEDGLDNIAKQRRLLQHLLDCKGCLIVIIADCDISARVAARLKKRSASGDRIDDEQKRWQQCLEQFQTAYGNRSGSHWRTLTEEPEAILTRECGWTTRLAAVAQLIRAHPDFPTWGENDIVAMVAHQAEATFETIWHGFDDQARRILFQLAKGNHFNPQKSSTMQRLLDCGTVVADPDYRIPGESFRRFILHAESGRQIRAWQQQTYGGLWSALRFPLIALLVAAAGILFFIQPETFQALTGFMAAMAAGIPILLRLFAAAPESDK